MSGGQSSSKSQTQRLTGVQVSGKGYNTPVQICYGTNRASPLLVQYTDFKAVKAKSAGGKGGGKGGGGQFEYSATVIMAVCEGSIQGFGKLWRDKEVYSAAPGFGYAIDGAFAFGMWQYGNYPNDTFPYMDTYHPAESIPYSGTALIASINFPLGSSATIGNLSLEVKGRCLGSAGQQNETDAHVKDVIADFIGNAYFGAVSAQSAAIGLGIDAMHQYCAARGILISPVLADQKSANEWLDEWLMIANTGLVWSEGSFKFKPYSEYDFGGYDADTAVRYHFDDDEISELIEPEFTKPVDRFNVQPVECLNRDASYNKFTYEAKDINDIRLNGIRTAQNITLDSVCLPGVAVRVALTQLKRNLYRTATYTIKTHADVDHLEPMDFITISDADMGIANRRLRIIEISDDPLGGENNGNITILAEEAPHGCYDG